MTKTLSIVLIVALGVAAVFGVSNLHHASTDMGACAAVCLEAFRPVATSAVTFVAFVLFLFFKPVAPAPVFQILFYRSKSPGRFRKKIARWFSLLEHSPTYPR